MGEIELTDILCNFVDIDDEHNNDNISYVEENNRITRLWNYRMKKLSTEEIVTFLKDVFPQYDTDVLKTIYNYTTNIDETIKKLLQMNKQYDIDVLTSYNKNKGN
tara:strand:+ start:1358 stop:1672 length:315 start_codon:yes stop_codon:yes gene_type:complete